MAETKQYVGAIDQGTTSTRFMIFDHDGHEVAKHQLEHEQILPQAGWVEHDASEIWECTQEVITAAMGKAGISAENLAAVGVTNQRETTVVWDKRTGEPYYNAIVWQDTRTDKIASALDASGKGDLIRDKAGLPPAPYFSGGKIQWILENVEDVRADADAGHAIFGNTDGWLLWWLTGGPDGGQHITDVTNASRTMLMNLETLDWDDELLGLFDIPRAMLPTIKSSSEVYGNTLAAGPFGGEVPLAGDLGDQHAALVGQVCFKPGELKNTYGTGNFLVLNTGTEIVKSKNGLITTVGYKFGDAPAVYALEGSIAVTGSAIQWLRDQLGIIKAAADSESLAEQRRGQRGRLLRACLLRSLRSLLALRCPWRDRRAVPLQHRRAHRPGSARGDLLPEQGRRRRHGRRCRSRPAGPPRRRGSDAQRAVHADPGRCARRLGEPPGRRRDHGAGCRVCSGPGGRVLGQHRRAHRQLERVEALGADLDPGAARLRARPVEEGR